MIELLHGDCLERLKELPDCSVDACVTDPPYGLSFMGKAWDYDVPSAEVWREVLRVLKPGGHLLAFAGTRTQHRMACRIEDAGFEIRDMIAWVYGSGFPKSLDVSKAIDKAAGEIRPRVAGGQGGANTILGARKCGEAISGEAISGEAQQWAGWGTALKPALEPITMARKPLAGTVAANVLEHGTGALNVDGCRIKPSIAPGGREWEEQRNRAFLSAAIAALSDKLTELERCPFTAAEPAEQTTSAKGENIPPATCKPGTGCSDGMKADNTSTSLSTGEFGRMPTAQSLTDIASIIETASRPTIDWPTWNSCQCPSTSAITSASIKAALKSLRLAASNSSSAGTAGRWPSNFIHDGSDEVVGLFPQTSPSPKTTKPKNSNAPQTTNAYGAYSDTGRVINGHGDSGSAVRFFYCAKASKADRGDGNTHPTVKPTELMRYLCRLVTPPGGVVLDPFMGSGSTGKAATLENFRFIGIEREAEYLEIARGRIQQPEQGSLL